MKIALISLNLILFFVLQNAEACNVCEENQPASLKGITHGTGPQDNWDYFIIGTASIIVVFTLFLSLKYLIRPDESEPDHIKNCVLK